MPRAFPDPPPRGIRKVLQPVKCESRAKIALLSFLLFTFLNFCDKIVLVFADAKKESTQKGAFWRVVRDSNP